MHPVVVLIKQEVHISSNTTMYVMLAILAEFQLPEDG
jgi:hypothetical protein